MDDMRFGDILSERRRQLGLSIDQAVSATKLRPHVLEAFERSDFDAMPPKGYAQGMISSYARFLRLDPRDVIEPYFDQLYAHERERGLQSRSDRSPRYESPDEVARRRRAPMRQSDMAEGVSEPSARSSRGYVSPLDHADASDSYSRDRSVGNVYRRERRDAFSSYDTGSYTAGASDRYDDDAYDDGYADDGYVSRRPTDLSRGRGSLDFGPDSPLGDIRRYLPFIAAAIALIVLIVIIALVVKSCSGDEPIEDPGAQPQIPVVGVTETVDTTTNSPAEPATGAVEGTPAATPAATPTDAAAVPTTPAEAPIAGTRNVEIRVDSGVQSWIDANSDGTTLIARTVSGPATETFSIEAPTEITIGYPSGVKVFVDGTEMEVPRSSGIGKLTIPVGE